jgi:alpha-L-fucosidase
LEINNVQAPERPGRYLIVYEISYGNVYSLGLYALPAGHEWVRSQEQISSKDYEKYFDHFVSDLYDPKDCTQAQLLRILMSNS